MAGEGSSTASNNTGGNNIAIGENAAKVLPVDLIMSS